MSTTSQLIVVLSGFEAAINRSNISFQHLHRYFSTFNMMHYIYFLVIALSLPQNCLNLVKEAVRSYRLLSV